MQDTSPSRRQGKQKKSAPRKRRKPLTAEGITAAAIEIADAEGLDAVSIRRIAAVLDARPMSLYDHFESKDELLASMADEVVGEVYVDPPLPEDWRKAMTAIARHNYAMFINHPWLVFQAGRQPRLGPNATKVSKQAAAATASLPVEEDEGWTVLGTVNDYVLGYSLRAVAAPRPEDLEDMIPESALAESPELASLPKSFRSRGSLERFESGLQIVLDGVERRVFGGDDP